MENVVRIRYTNNKDVKYILETPEYIGQNGLLIKASVDQSHKNLYIYIQKEHNGPWEAVLSTSYLTIHSAKKLVKTQFKLFGVKFRDEIRHRNKIILEEINEKIF